MYAIAYCAICRILLLFNWKISAETYSFYYGVYNKIENAYLLLSKMLDGRVSVMDNKVVGQRIKGLRLNRKMTREVLAEAAEMSVSFLYEIETGKKRFSS